MNRAALKAVALPVLMGCAVLSARSASSVLVSRDVYLMGTRAQLSIYAATRDGGLATLESALAVIEDAEEELSTWRPSSRISALNRHPVGEPWTATPRLCRMFRDVWEWHRATGGAFDPAIGQLLAAWDIHGEGAVPVPEARPRVLGVVGDGAARIRPGPLHADQARRRRD